MKTCCFCGRRAKCAFVLMENGNWRCKSGTACQTRMHKGKPRDNSGPRVGLR